MLAQGLRICNFLVNHSGFKVELPIEIGNEKNRGEAKTAKKSR